MKAPIDLNLVRSFVAVYETGRFSAAAAQLGVPRSTVSRAVAALEESTGLLLFHRTTRVVRATPAAATLFDRVSPSLAALEASLGDLPERAGAAPTGTLRITTTPDIGGACLAEVSTRFTARYPGTRVEMILTPSVLDLAKDGIDLAIRVTPRGLLKGNSLVAQKLGRLVIQTYASPTYLARRGTPKTPQDLGAHDWVGFTDTNGIQLSSGSTKVRVDLETRIACDDMRVAREIIRQGGGIGALPSFLADGDIGTGTLVRVLPKWTTMSGSIHLLHPSRRHVPARVTAYRDLILETLRQHPLSPAE